MKFMVIQLFASFVMLSIPRPALARPRGKVQSASFSNPLFEFTKCVWRRLVREKLRPRFSFDGFGKICAYNPVAVYFFDATTRLLVDSALSLLLTNLSESCWTFVLFRCLVECFLILTSREIKVSFLHKSTCLYTFQSYLIKVFIKINKY